MKEFIKKILLFITPIILFIILFIILLANQADGYTDPFYIRFTTPKQKSLILGTSRAAQGLQPKVINSIIKNCNISNYAFTIGHSPFGPAYLESIKNKINKERGGVFIITVDPWSISSMCSDPNNLKLFRENKLCVANTKIVDWNPNFEYLYKNLKGDYKKLISPPSRSMFLHKDGWLEIKNIPMDSVTVNKRINAKIKYYKEINLPKTHLSGIRIKYLLNTILFLKDFGKVYLVRLPIHPEMMKIENKISQNLDSVIIDAINNSDGYLDLTYLNDKFQYTDGNHLYKTSGKEVSKIVANWINGNYSLSENN